MNFLRRLIGAPTSDTDNSKHTDLTKPSAIANGVAPEISLPGTATASSPPAPLIQGVTKYSTQEITEPRDFDPTPMFGVTRQLPPLESLTSKPSKHVIYGLSTDIGMIRNNNQDSVFTFYGSSVSAESRPDFGLFIVADGMGGHHDGEHASAIAIRVIALHMLENFYLALLKIAPNDVDRPILSEVLSEAVQKANEAVSGEIPEGGTTVTAAAMLSDLLCVAHVGDSRAYLIAQDKIEQITRDHSLVQRLIELDKLTKEEAETHPQRNVLYRAIGQSDELEVDTFSCRLGPGSRLMLCSDGLWNEVSDARFLHIVQSAKTPQEACDHLITLANDGGGRDNITVVLVQVPG
ncbi:MAG: Stp1/IreP family PP2C-type Ser/Thr phosphatase [Chloroflexota bacterium]